MSHAGSPRRSRPLQALRRSDAAAFGGKSAALGELLAAEVPVPPGLALSTAAFDVFMAQSDLEAVVAGALAAAASGDAVEVGQASETIAEAMRLAPVPGAVADELALGYRELAELVGEASPPVAVRSSAVGEDSAEATFAGQQATYLWVRGADEVTAAVRDCWASLYSAPAISYRARLANEVTPAMGVTIQLMVDSAISGVMFTCNPVSGDPSMVAINASWGLGLAIVGGEVTPDDYLVSKITGETVRHQINRKDIQYVPAADGRGTEQVDVPADRRELECLDAETLASLAQLGRRVELHFGSPQDIEWAIDHAGDVFVVQSRPVTGIRKRKPATVQTASALSLVMGTFGAGTRHDS